MFQEDREILARVGIGIQVEGTIIELGQMFTKMAELVSEQGEVVDRIDADMTTALSNVEAGMVELQKFYSSIKRHRGFILKILAVMALIVVLFTAFKS